MQKRMTLIIGLVMAGAAAIAGIASASAPKPIVVRDKNLVLTIGGGVIPNRLPAHTLKPISVTASGRIQTSDGTHPPALREVVIDAAGTAVIEADKFPTCKAGEIEASATEQAESTCRGAIVGRGSTEVEVEFAESAPFKAKGPLVIFNGGEKDGKTLMLIHAYVAVPAPTAIVSRVVTTKEHKGPYLLHIVAGIPVIAGGAGSVTRFSLDINKPGYLLADCSHGDFNVLTTAIFQPEPSILGKIAQPCIPIH